MTHTSPPPPSLLSSQRYIGPRCSVTLGLPSNQHPFIHLLPLTNGEAQSWQSPPTHLLPAAHTHTHTYPSFLFYMLIHSSCLSFCRTVLPPQWMKTVQRSKGRGRGSVKRDMNVQRVKEGDYIQIIFSLTAHQDSWNLKDYICMWSFRSRYLSGTNHKHMQVDQSLSNSLKRKWRHITSVIVKYFFWGSTIRVFVKVSYSETNSKSVVIFHLNLAGRHSSFMLQLVKED